MKIHRIIFRIKRGVYRCSWSSTSSYSNDFCYLPPLLDKKFQLNSLPKLGKFCRYIREFVPCWIKIFMFRFSFSSFAQFFFIHLYIYIYTCILTETLSACLYFSLSLSPLSSFCFARLYIKDFNFCIFFYNTFWYCFNKCRNKVILLQRSLFDFKVFVKMFSRNIEILLQT